MDAYFFLRYLRTLLKLFIPMALVILPILLPLNAVGGRGPTFAIGQFHGSSYQNVSGLDRLAWGNVRPDRTDRYWAHLILAVGVVIYTCFVFFEELKGYVRLRQSYLTSPQHRLRASATTVLVTAIPPKWCTFQALDGLYDVFPGGVRNIWINRNFDALNDKIKQRHKLASALESAETSLVRNAKKAHTKKVQVQVEMAGKRGSSTDVVGKLKTANGQDIAMAQTDGISAGDPHQVRHTLDEALAESSDHTSGEHLKDPRKRLVPIPVLSQGISAAGHGIGTLGKTMLGGLKNVARVENESNSIKEEHNTSIHQSVGVQINSLHNQVAIDLDGGRSRSASLYYDRDHDACIAPIRAHTHSLHHRSSNESTVRQSSLQDGAEHPPSPFSTGRQGLGIEGAATAPRHQVDSSDMISLRNPQRLCEAEGPRSLKRRFWNRKQATPFGIPSPNPHGHEEDEYPLSRLSPMTPGCNPQATINGPQTMKDLKNSCTESKPVKGERAEKAPEVYPKAYNENWNSKGREPVWKHYLDEKDRDTMRLPVFGWHWMVSLPLLGTKVDTIHYCRKELARLNLEIEHDQKEPEKFPLLNSAFVQFNHQVAAHMACQAVSHHTPNQMAPRTVEISPDDVIWDNMSIKWWESYIRTGAVILIIIGLVIGWAVPVTFTGFLSQVSDLAKSANWLHWLLRMPDWVLSIIQGILPQALLGLLLLLLPVILRLLARTQGDYTGMAVELSVQQYYFAFLFVQVFLVVSISSGITTVLNEITHSPELIPSILAENLPKASNYFFSYLLLQALSTSAGALVQVLNLIEWFVLAPLLDSTARQKWRRQIKLPDVQWGTFFPVYTNFACIGQSISKGTL